MIQKQTKYEGTDEKINKNYYNDDARTRPCGDGRTTSPDVRVSGTTNEDWDARCSGVDSKGRETGGGGGGGAAAHDGCAALEDDGGGHTDEGGDGCTGTR